MKKVPAVPLRIKKGGSGYGLALGFDPRVDQTHPGAGVLDEVLSIKQVGDGGAVRIENDGRGTALSVDHQNKAGAAASFIGGNVGIGADKPKAKLHLSSEGSVELLIEADTGNSGITEKHHPKIVFSQDGGATKAYLGFSGTEASGANDLTLKNNSLYGALHLETSYGKKVTVDTEGNLQAEGRIRDKTGEVMPVGTVVAFAGKKAPAGWLMCRGQSVTDPKYSELAEVLGKTLPFNVPNYQHKFLVGAQGTGDYKLGNTGGAAFVELKSNQMPRHKHDATIEKGGEHRHRISIDKGGDGNKDYRGKMLNTGDSATKMNNAIENLYWHTQSAGDHSHKVTINLTGWGAPHENRPPFVALNYIIKY